MMHSPCEACKWHLGGGCCRLNAEDECGEGGGYELWEPREVQAPDIESKAHRRARLTVCAIGIFAIGGIFARYLLPKLWEVLGWM